MFGTPLVNPLFSWLVSLMFSHLVICLINEAFFQLAGHLVESFSYLVTNLVSQLVNQSVKESDKWSI